MEILDRITKTLKEQHKSQKDLTDYLGISQNNYTDWKSGRLKSYKKYLPQIAQFFNVSVDYFLVDRDTQKKGDAIADIILEIKSNSDLLEVVQNLRTLSAEELKAVNLFITTFKK